MFYELNIASLSLIDKTFFYMTTYFYVQATTSLSINLGCCCMTVSTLKNFLERSLAGPCNKNNSEILFKTSLIYEKVCHIIGNCSSFYKFMLVPFFMIFLFYNLLFTFGLFVYQMNPNNQLYIFTKMTLLWVSLYSPFVFFVYSFSSVIISECQKIIGLVQLIAAKDRSHSSLRKGINLALFFAHQKPQMTCKLFDINWRTFSAFMGSTWAYTIILVQFYDASNK